MDQIILKYIDKQNYFFLNYFEKKIYNLKSDFLGIFNIMNDLLQVTWNNKLIEEFIFHSKNNEFINIYKITYNNIININIFHKKWFLNFTINNNTNQIYNSIEQIYGNIQKISDTEIKIIWLNNKYEHIDVEEFILNTQNNYYYLVEQQYNLIEKDFKKIYNIKYLQGIKIITKKILLDNLYNIIYDFTNLSIIGSFKIFENLFYIKSNLLNETIFININNVNNVLYSEIILKYIYKSIIIKNNKFYFYNKKLLNFNNIKYNYCQNLILLFIDNKQYIYDLNTLKDIT